MHTNAHRLIFTNLNSWFLTALLLAAVTLAPVCAATEKAGASPLELIVQAHDLATAAEAVRAVGGTVTHELAIINAVGARLTLAQLDRLIDLDDLRVYENRPLEVADSGSTETVRDEFAVQSYSNNDGTVNWASDWIETNDYGGATSGDIGVMETQRLRIRRPDRSIHRAVYLPTGSTARLSFTYQRAAFTDPGHYVTLEISADSGASWTELERF